jgi:hypothetical protein
MTQPWQSLEVCDGRVHPIHPHRSGSCLGPGVWREELVRFYLKLALESFNEGCETLVDTVAYLIPSAVFAAAIVATLAGMFYLVLG